MLSRRRSPEDDKLVALRQHRALNPKPQAVRDPAFISGNPFFDSRDLVQVKYEMAGLPGLVRERPGPRRAHKLSEEVVDFLEQELSEEPAPKMSQLVELLRERYRLSVHVRSVERALARRRKKGLAMQMSLPPARTRRS